MLNANLNKNTLSKSLLYQRIFEEINPLNKPVFMCVGTDKIVADSLGPIVAEKLKKSYRIPAYVYGGLDYNINATNLIECYNYIKTIHPNSAIVLIDATLAEDVGQVKICKGAFAGAGNVLPSIKIGDISILGVVGKKGKDFRLNSVRIKDILDMAEIIANTIAMVYMQREEFLDIL